MKNKGLLVFILLAGLLPLQTVDALESSTGHCNCDNTVPMQPVATLSLNDLSVVVDKMDADKVKGCGLPPDSPFLRDFGTMAAEEIKSKATLSSRTLLVVHAHSKYGVQAVEGINELVALTKSRREPVVFMLEDSDLNTWQTKDRSANLVCLSTVGQHSFDVKTNELVMAGGIYGACLTEAARLAIQSALANTRGTVVVHYPMSAITNVRRNKLADDVFSSDDKKNQEQLLQLTEYNRSYWKSRSVHIKLFLNGREVPTPEPAQKSDRVVEFKFWSSVQNFRDGTEQKVGRLEKPGSSTKLLKAK